MTLHPFVIKAYLHPVASRTPANLPHICPSTSLSLSATLAALWPFFLQPLTFLCFGYPRLCLYMPSCVPPFKFYFKRSTPKLPIKDDSPPVHLWWYIPCLHSVHLAIKSHKDVGFVYHGHCFIAMKELYLTHSGSSVTFWEVKTHKWNHG